MGLLDELAGAFLGGAGGAQGGAAAGARGPGGAEISGDQLGALAQSVLEMLNGQQGGLDGFAERFRQAGLGPAVDSWIGTGANQPISPQDLGRALGPDVLSELARRAGLGGARGGAGGAGGLGAGGAGGPDLQAILAQLLPLLIDRLTPQGRAPQGGSLLELGLELLRGASAGGGGRRF